jgi:hypothetical protein
VDGVAAAPGLTMYLGFYNFYSNYNGNRMFTDPASPIGDDLGYPTVRLGQRVRELGHRIATIDTDDLDKFDAVVFIDHPTLLNPYFRRLRKRNGTRPLLALLLAENPANRPDNYWKSGHAAFDKVFTWHSDLVDGRKYIQCLLPNRVPSPFRIAPEEKTRFCTTISSQKYNSHPAELYSERLRAIRWFEQHQPAEFDLYGTLWDRRWFSGRLARLNLLLSQAYRKFPEMGKCSRFPSWRGPVARKHDVLRQYRFSICYENAVFPGYITEKLFDCWFAGCVPVYLGAPDILRFVPAGTFIDKRNFSDYAEVFRYLKNMPRSEYDGYLAAIESFVNSAAIRSFSAEGFADTMIRHLIPGVPAA